MSEIRTPWGSIFQSQFITNLLFDIYLWFCLYITFWKNLIGMTWFDLLKRWSVEWFNSVNFLFPP